MDVTTSTSVTMGPPVHSSPEMDTQGPSSNGNCGDVLHGQNGITTNGMSAAAATSAQQPKVVQTAFIHKLYKYESFELPPSSHAYPDTAC